jgi:transposase-like protein
MGEINRHFTPEFKRDAVQLVTEKGMPVRKVARELDIHPQSASSMEAQVLSSGGIRPSPGKAVSSQRSGDEAASEAIRKSEGGA